MIKSIQFLWLLFSVCMRLTQNKITKKAFIILDIFPDLLHFRANTFSWVAASPQALIYLSSQLTMTIQSHADAARTLDDRYGMQPVSTCHSREAETPNISYHSLLSDHVCTPTFPQITNSQSWILKNSLIFFTEQFQLQCKWCFVVLFCAIPYSDQNIQYRWANQCFVLLNKQVTSM